MSIHQSITDGRVTWGGGCQSITQSHRREGGSLRWAKTESQGFWTAPNMHKLYLINYMTHMDDLYELSEWLYLVDLLFTPFNDMYVLNNFIACIMYYLNNKNLFYPLWRVTGIII